MEFNNQIQELRKILIEAYQSIREKDRIITSQIGRAYIQAKIDSLAILIKHIDLIQKGGDIDMKQLKDGLATHVIKLDDLPTRSRGSEWESRIVELAKSLKKGEAAKINGEAIKFGHFSTKVYVLKKAGKLPETTKVVKRGEEFYLANA